jgi:hypothetical protein
LNGDFSLSGDFPVLSSGNYDLQVVDANGCLFNQQINLIQQNVQLGAVLDSVPVICETPGLIQVVEVIGGLAPFEILVDEQVIPEGGAQVDSNFHTLLITDINGCVLADTFQVGFINHTEAIFTADPYIENVPFEVYTDNTSLNATTYLWYIDGELADSIAEPSFTFLESGEFDLELLAIDELNGCRDSMNYIVYAKPQNAIYIPNAFSPDNDGINDVFFVKGENIDDDGFEGAVGPFEVIVDDGLAALDELEVVGGDAHQQFATEPLESAGLIDEVPLGLDELAQKKMFGLMPSPAVLPGRARP